MTYRQPWPDHSTGSPGRSRRGLILLGTLVVVGGVTTGIAFAVNSGGGAVVGKGSTGTPTSQPTGTPTGVPTSSTSSPPPGSPHGQVVWGETTAFPTNLMPITFAGNTTAVENLTVRVLDGLFRSGPDFAYAPDADQGGATSAQLNGQQVVDIKINPSAVWADGRPITAEDYIFTIDTQKSLDPAAGGCATLLSSIGFDQVERAVQVSDKEVKIYFQRGRPYADWRALFAGGSAPILSKHVLDQGSPSRTCAAITKGWPASGGIPLGAQNGPWLLLGRNVAVDRKTITLVPNPRYWGAMPALARLVHQTTGTTSDTNVRALQNNEVDVVYPLPQLDLVAQLKQLTGVTTTVGFGSAYEHLDFNTKDPLLRYPQIRQAIALSIDRRALATKTVGQFSDRAQALGNHLVLNTQQGYEDHSGQYAGPNIAKAAQLIRSVGGTRGSDGYYRVKGRPLSFRVMTTIGNPVRDQTISIMAQQVKQAGIKLTEFTNPDIFQDRSKPSSLEAERFQIALFAWGGSPALSFSNSIYLSRAHGGAQNYSQGSDPVVDRYLQQMATAPSPEAELTAANAADRQLWTDMFTLPLYQKPTVLAFRNTIQGLADNGTPAGPLWNCDTIRVP